MTGDVQAIEDFIARWEPSGGGERSNCQMFLAELCRLLGVGEPEPAVEDESRNAYVFERKVPARRLEGPTTANFIDLYKRGCFVLEAKQSRKRQKQLEELRHLGFDLPERRSGSGQRGGQQWDTLMRNAREQAENYAKRLPPDEGWPPFLVIVDVGHVIELYADFSLQGKHYAQFPDRQSYRIYLNDLRREDVRKRLRLIWTDPQVLNPARRTAEVTREVAELLAKLSTSLETRMLRAVPKDRQPEQLANDRRDIAEKVALFLMRCLFTMFAEDVGLLKRDSFAGLLREYKGQANRVHHSLQRLWNDMNVGGFSPDLRIDILKFNGGLFRDATALELTEDDLQLLTIAAERDWKDVEPAIFGTLLERALDPGERHRLGAHYTPRAYVERLVVATIIEPLTEEWRNVQAAAAQLMEADDEKKARAAVQEFHRRLCNVRVLDPACGTGNFLYVAMELMKRLEGEVLETLTDLGERQYVAEIEGHTVDPHQFLGLEINPRAVAIAELVLWIGYLQWHFRTRGRVMPQQPVLKNFANIREQDAVIEYDSWDVLRDDTGRPVTRWDGMTYKLHPITGEEVPDEAARIELRTYLNPRPAKWPQAEFIVGNPPFVGNKKMIEELGEGYSTAVRKAYSEIPSSVDFVMYWWHQAALKVRSSDTKQFGFITTNSITQFFNRKILHIHLSAKKNALSIIFAVPDHPWIKASDKAAVRVAMDAHRKDVLAKHKQLTMTGLYNVLEKVRAGGGLSDADRDVYDAGLVGVLKQIHDNLDAAVAEAYGWPADLTDEEILERLVALNRERAAEEAEGKVRWLRPEFQAPKEAAGPKAKQMEAELLVAEGKARKPSLPAKLPDQVAAIRAALADLDDIVTPRELSRYFSQGRRVENKVEDVLRTLALLGQAQQVEDAYFLSD